MRHLNPWVLWPVLIAGSVGGVIGWIVTAISCQPATCVATSGAVAVVAALVSALGVGVVAVLAIRSLAEWREAQDRGLPAPEVGCEVPPEPDRPTTRDAGEAELTKDTRTDAEASGDQAGP